METEIADDIYGTFLVVDGEIVCSEYIWNGDNIGLNVLDRIALRVDKEYFMAL